MSNRISICYFPEQEKESFIDFIESTSCCMRCGSSNLYKKNKLPAYLERLQLLAGEYKLPFPSSLYYFFRTTENKVEQVLEGIFIKKAVVKTTEIGNASLYLEFKDDLSEEDTEKWKLVVAGMFATIKALK